MKNLEFPIEGENTIKPYKVRWGNDIKASFKTLLEAEIYCDKDLGRTYDILFHGRIVKKHA